MLDQVHSAPPLALVVFGASGDLTARKLLPAIGALNAHGALPDRFTIIGVARTQWSDDEFRKVALDAVPQGGPKWAEVVARFRYVCGEYAHPDTFDALRAVLGQCDRELGTAGNRVYYLATVPSLFAEVAEAIAEHGCNVPGEGGRFARLVVEKPLGRDLRSARELDAALHNAFDESQIYRIDHYMGKETVQNLLALRFANAVFEPVWNRRYVDSVQITVAEQLGVEHRGGFYETAGALRDIVQNHVMQVLALTLMEPPTIVDANGIRDEKIKLLKAVDVPASARWSAVAVRGQYESGQIDGRPVVGYCDEDGVAADSTTETYVALKLSVDNWRWAGVPVYVRTGKRLPERITEVAMEFRNVPHLAFGERLARDLGPNRLIVQIQPHEGVRLEFGAKVPGEEFRLKSVDMAFNYSDAFPEVTADAYERLLHDVMIGDPTLFVRSDEVDRAWQIVDPVLDAFADGAVPISTYPAGSWGPHQADVLLAADGRQWRDP
ncbi:MAG: glucose-6-phosphate dehydrogenase [Acidimicrobiales bacterium]